jgi:hypothetical protein
MAVAAAGAAVGFPAGSSVALSVLAVAVVVAVAFALAESVVMHVEIRDSVHSVSLNEIPLVLGLFWLPPPLLVAARLLGAFVGLRMGRKQSAPKVVFNLSSMTLETVVAVLAFRRWSGGRAPTPWSGSGW